MWLARVIEHAATWVWTVAAATGASTTQPAARTISLGGWLTLVVSWVILGGGLVACIWIAAHHRVVGSGTTESDVRSPDPDDP